MNFFEGKIEDGCFVSPYFTAPLNEEQKKLLASYEGKEIILGSRPENIVQDPNGYMNIKVTLNENLGQTTLVHGNIKGQKLTAKFRVWCEYKKDDVVSASIDRMHFFDKKTTIAIR
jgi:multiple sugar transport system ATP-binding protein